MHSRHRNLRRQIGTTATIAIIFIFLFINISYASGATCNTILLQVYPDGSVLVNTTITVTEAPENITVDLLGPALYAYAEDQSGLPLPIHYDNKTATITVYSNGTVLVSYYTLDITSKRGDTWTLDVETLCTTIVLLPDTAVPIEMTPTPDPVLVGNDMGFEFKNGSVHIEYYVLPGEIRLNQTSQVPSPSPATNGRNRGLLEVGIGIAIIIFIIILIYLIIIRRRGESRTEFIKSILDERDRAILKALEEGPKSAPELIQETRIPKTPLYRRLKKLLEEGYIEVFEEGGVRKYKLKKS